MLGANGLQETPAPRAAAADGLVKPTTTAAFRVDVIAESTRQPVLVDFWAPWCGPCKQLTPVLELVVRQAGGKVKLVTLDIDAHPEIPGQLGIQSIPAVIAFQKGQPVDGFTGALPAGQIRDFIERLVGPVAGEGAELVAQAEAAFGAHDYESAAEGFAQALALDPADPQAVGGMARALIALGDLDLARETLESAPAEAQRHGALLAARAALEVADKASGLGDVGALRERVSADSGDHQASIDLAVALNARGEREAAADALLDSIRRDRSWDDGAARKQLLQFFEVWGPMERETLGARRKLSGILFS